ncbi:hypothetical protein TK35_11725 [Lacticaseibacillus paracasei]|uniref:hypothetical protein n=1 Tax=Lacticaseibacillus paracasei TaxID=1597 RepID=UPI00106405C8|nr:hypothetical protein [Lacticaseibacillus paracasei]TEA87070.1 hypothetical protein TK35_11725 [Lacticaseibacillus paracasei]TEA88867.1 hypothetical protein TK36_11705 [Lacticaseibacillus paracasei]
MLSEKTIRGLITTPVFLANANQLAYQLHVSHQDASEELLLELLLHRLRTWTNKDVGIAVQRDLASLKWRVKYARKDLVRQSHKDATRELDKVQMLAGMEPQASNEAETLEALERLRELFKNANTRDWCGSILRFGQKETMVRFNNQTRRQFNNKLTKVCKYARQHRQHNQSSSNAKELELLKEWDDLMADPETSDDAVQLFIDQHGAYIDNIIINDPQVAFQGRLIKNFAHAGKDKYVFANLMAKREQQLKESK